MRNLLSLLLLGFIVFVAFELSARIDLPQVAGMEQHGCPDFPTSTQEIARTIGGASNHWSKSGQRSWTYRGAIRLRFTVPDGCVFALSTGNKRAGEEISIAGGETITWPE